MSYGFFSQYYDFFTRNVDYKSYALRIDDIIKSLGLKRGSLVDLGCGTASLDIELAKLGYSVTGIDLSCEMLTAAANKVYSQGASVRLVNQDMTEFSLPQMADTIICTLDGLNHLDGIESVKKTFKRVKKFLTPHGIFIFDMNTVYKHRFVLGDNCFIFDSDEAYLGWQNDYDPSDDSVEITLDFFVPGEKGYSRTTESFFERAYEQGVIASALEASGLRALSFFDGLSCDAAGEKTERMIVVAAHTD